MDTIMYSYQGSPPHTSRQMQMAPPGIYGNAGPMASMGQVQGQPIFQSMMMIPTDNFLAQPLPADALEEMLGVFPCCRLRGIPFQANVEDVLRFFSGLVVLDVVMVCRHDGRGAGEALVVFTNPMDLNLALSRDKQNMGRRYVEVIQAQRIDYYQAISGQLHHTDPRPPYRGSQHHHHQQHRHHHHQQAHMQQMPLRGGGVDGEHTGVLRLRGLPFVASREDILHFFNGLSVLPDSVQFVVRNDGRATGEAFVTMASRQDAEAALGLNGHHIGNRYVEIFPSSAEEAVRITSRYM